MTTARKSTDHWLNSLFLLLLLNISAQCIFAQEPGYKPATADYYLSEIKHSRDSVYNRIIRDLESFIAAHPDSIRVKIVRCRVINEAYYDTYEDYNPNYELFTICLDDLVRNYSENRDVLFYKMENSYSDSLIYYGEKLLDINSRSDRSWTDEKLALVYQMLGNTYYYQDKNRKSLDFYLLAQELNDTLNLHNSIALNYIDMDQYEAAEKALLKWADSTLSIDEKRTKADNLLEVGNTEKAIELYEVVMKDSNIWVDYDKVAKAFTERGEYDKARKFKRRSVENTYYKNAALHQLFLYDYQHSPADTLLSTYNELMDRDWKNDAYGKYRLMLFAKKPLSGWRFSDLGKFLISALILCGLFIFPYLFILPLYYLSHHYFKRRKIQFPESNWGLKDFWLIASATLIISFINSFIFHYEVLLTYFDISSLMEEKPALNKDDAYSTILFSAALALITAIFVLKKKQFQLRSYDWSLEKCIGVGIGMAFALRICYVILVKAGLFPELDLGGEASIVDSIRSVNLFVHPAVSFMMTVIIVPIYEEYIFRGIALSAMEKRVGFIYANIFQSVLFALMHDNLNIFFFYVAFGLIAGRLASRSGSMVPGIIFHATNNLFAWLYILFMQ